MWQGITGEKGEGEGEGQSLLEKCKKRFGDGVLVSKAARSLKRKREVEIR